jgi:phospholipid/cholesterol/gamma-HCH transport system ATP-binding protein
MMGSELQTVFFPVFGCSSRPQSHYSNIPIFRNHQGLIHEYRPHIVVKNLTMAYGSFVLQRDLNFTIYHGDVFIIMGGSGCGKSTLLRHLVGLNVPAQGQILYDGTSFWDVEPDERDHIMRRIGILYQSGALWSSMTLLENVELPLGQYTDLNPAQIRELVP